MNIDAFVKQSDWEQKIAQAPYNVKVTKTCDYTMLKYNQIESDFSFEEVRQCRGIIFRDSDMKCVCRPFYKFFNYGEPNAAEIDWESDYLTVLEKIDGSLIKVWYDDDEWHISTNGTIDAFLAFIGGISIMTYGDLFVQYCNEHGFDFDVLPKNYTHMFELVSPLTRVVVPYDKLGVYYLTSIETETGWEDMFRDEMSQWFYLPEQIKVDSLGKLVAQVQDMDWTHEGFVVWDGVNRIKVKSPAYVLAHYGRMNGNLSWESLVKVVLQHEVDEFVNYADEWAEDIYRICGLMEAAEHRGEQYRYIITGVFDMPRAEYAAFVKELLAIANDEKYLNFCFRCYDNHALTWSDYVASWEASRWVKFLELKG